MDKPEKASIFASPLVRGWLITLGILAVLLGSPAVISASVWYAETKGPFKNLTQVVDLEGDGDLDIVVSHTRWEAVNLSWAGIGRWINQGDGKFELADNQDTGSLAGFAAGVGDVDHDGDADMFVQDFRIRLLENQGGAQGGEGGRFLSGNSGINLASPYDGYRDMGGSIEMGDLNGDGWADAFVAGCCYGLNATRPEDDYPHDPSVSWVWINDGRVRGLMTGHSLRMEELDGLPVRGAALGDVDGDGDVDVFAAVGKPTMGAAASVGDLILLNDGTGALRALDQRLGDADSTSVALGDVDGDGDVDVFAAVGKPTMGAVASVGDLILLNDGTGALRALDQRLGDADSTSIALGDVNGDGRLDALVGTNAGATLWLNQGVNSSGPVFVPAEQAFGAVQSVGKLLGAGFSSALNGLLGWDLAYGSVRTKGAHLSDLDGDGDLDALIARIWEAEVWWNDGLGGFTRSPVLFTYDEDSGVAVADFDGDGDQDVFAGGNARKYRVWLNQGEGVFGG